MLQLFFCATETIASAAEQTASAPPSLFITIVASAFGGALITSGVTIWAKYADSKADQRKWLREQKLNCYVELYILFDEANRHFREHQTMENFRYLWDDIKHTLAKSELLAPDYVADSFVNLIDTVNGNPVKKEVSEALDKVARAMRKDLGIKPS